MDQPMDLNMEIFETATLFTTVVTVAFVCQDGKSNWLKVGLYKLNPVHRR
jgi:Ca2+:H+ antiporter